MDVCLPAATTGENFISTKDVITNSFQLFVHWKWVKFVCANKDSFSTRSQSCVAVWERLLHIGPSVKTNNRGTLLSNEISVQNRIMQCHFTKWYVRQYIFHFFRSLDRNKDTREKLGAAKSLQEMKEICQNLKRRVQVRIKIFIEKK